MTKTVWATYQVARNRHRISRFPADSLPLATWPASASDPGRGYPPSVYILYLYGYPKRGQNEGIFPAFEDELRFIIRHLALNSTH